MRPKPQIASHFDERIFAFRATKNVYVLMYRPWVFGSEFAGSAVWPHNFSLSFVLCFIYFVSRNLSALDLIREQKLRGAHCDSSSRHCRAYYFPREFMATRAYVSDRILLRIAENLLIFFCARRCCALEAILTHTHRHINNIGSEWCRSARKHLN